MQIVALKGDCLFLKSYFTNFIVFQIELVIKIFV